MNIAHDRNYTFHQARKAVWVIHSRGRFREFKELKNPTFKPENVEFCSESYITGTFIEITSFKNLNTRTLANSNLRQKTTLSVPSKIADTQCVSETAP